MKWRCWNEWSLRDVPFLPFDVSWWFFFSLPTPECLFPWECNLKNKFTLKFSKMTSHGHLLVQRLCKDGITLVLKNKLLLLGQRQLWISLHCLLFISHLQPPSPFADAAGRGGLGQLYALLTCCGKTGGQGIISGQDPPEISAGGLSAQEHVSTR